MIPFDLKDQFDNEYSGKNFHGYIVILVGSDKEGSKYNVSWGKAIHDSLKNESGFGQIKFLPVADLRGVPFFLKGLVKGKFPKEKERWTVMDWKGQFAEAYQFEAGASNIIIFERDGKRIHQAAVRDLEPETLREILTVLRGLMDGGQ